MPKRRADWLVGRLAAKEVVGAALADGTGDARSARDVEVAAEPGGRPYARVAPGAAPVSRFGPGERLPVSLSISHAGDHALCAATWIDPPGTGRAVGIDLGVVEPRSREFVADFLTEEEQRFVRDGAAPEREVRANLVWCAKEAVLKALGLGLTVDTRDVTCLPRPDRAEGESRLSDGERWHDAVESRSSEGERWRPFAVACRLPCLATGGELRGVWRSFPGGFVGALAVYEGAPPRREPGASRPGRPPEADPV